MKPGGSEILGSSKKGTMETNSSIQFATTPRLLHDLHNDFLSEGGKGVSVETCLTIQTGGPMTSKPKHNTKEDQMGALNREFKPLTLPFRPRPIKKYLSPNFADSP